MKFNKNKKVGGFGQNQRGSKNDKFFKRDKNDNKFKPYQKDGKGKFQRSDNKKNGGFKKHFSKKDEQKKQLNNFQSRRQEEREDKGGYRQYQNPLQHNEHKKQTSQNGNNSAFNQKQNFKQKTQDNWKDKKVAKQNKGFNAEKKSFNKNHQNMNKNVQKSRHSDGSDDDSDVEAPVINYCLAPTLLEKKLKRKEQLEKKEKKVDKREEYLKQKQRRNEILKQKTRKGQPVMAGRLQLLYEKVQKVVAKENEGS